MISTKKFAELFGIHINTVWNMIMDGRVKAVKVGRQYRISNEEVERIKNGGTSAVG